MNRDAQGNGWIVVAALGGAVAVVAGAFSAHGLDPVADAKAIGWLQTGSSYQALHALAMLAVVALSRTASIQGRLALAAQWFFLAGSILFPGALYGLALSGPRWLGVVAPLGGLAFIAGWLSLALAALVNGKQADRA
jgi:uncharacterized membrane protein YgdD (TMEM256/DUF423 family)